jgi:hypothetical protein
MGGTGYPVRVSCVYLDGSAIYLADYRIKNTNAKHNKARLKWRLTKNRAIEPIKARLPCFCIWLI